MYDNCTEWLKNYSGFTLTHPQEFKMCPKPLIHTTSSSWMSTVSASVIYRQYWLKLSQFCSTPRDDDDDDDKWYFPASDELLASVLCSDLSEIICWQTAKRPMQDPKERDTQIANTSRKTPQNAPKQPISMQCLISCVWGKWLKLLTQMSDFKAKSTPNSILAGALSQTRWGSSQCSPKPP